MSAFNDTVELSARRTLSEYGWLSGIRTALDKPIEVEEIACPECDDDTELLVWAEPGDMCTIITCRACEKRDEIPDEELYR